MDLLNMRQVLTGDHLKDEHLISMKKDLRLKERLEKDGSSSTYVDGLTCATISSYKEINQLISLGEKNRHVSSTKQNQTSSRSHSICIIQIVQHFPD